jgi:AcrR family transcriptional regulator
MPKIVDHDERRIELVQALWRVVERDGSAAISIRHVAAEAGLSKSAVSHYFPTRFSMLAAAVDELSRNVYAKVAALDLDDGRIETACEAIMATIPDSRARRKQSEVWILLVTEGQTDPDIRKLLAELDREVARGVSAFLKQLKRSGLVNPSRDIEFETARLHALIDGISLHTLHSPVGMPPKRIRLIVSEHLRELAAAPIAAVGSR